MTITLDGKEVTYTSLSGGEKRRIDCALCFGLSKYITLKYQLGSGGILGLLILDEVFSYLDQTGEDALAILLAEEGKDKAVFVIDHMFGLKAYADDVWTVKKASGISTLEICAK